jgi:hypothetical protein
MAYPARRLRPAKSRRANQPVCRNGAPDLSSELRQSLAAAADGGVVAEADYPPMLCLCDLGLVVVRSRQGDESQYIATAEGHRVAEALIGRNQGRVP